jgi:hypothetical protein
LQIIDETDLTMGRLNRVMNETIDMGKITSGDQKAGQKDKQLIKVIFKKV